MSSSHPCSLIIVTSQREGWLNLQFSEHDEDMEGGEWEEFLAYPTDVIKSSMQFDHSDITKRRWGKSSVS